MSYENPYRSFSLSSTSSMSSVDPRASMLDEPDDKPHKQDSKDRPYSYDDCYIITGDPSGEHLVSRIKDCLDRACGRGYPVKIYVSPNTFGRLLGYANARWRGNHTLNYDPGDLLFSMPLEKDEALSEDFSDDARWTDDACQKIAIVTKSWDRLHEKTFFVCSGTEESPDYMELSRKLKEEFSVGHSLSGPYSLPIMEKSVKEIINPALLDEIGVSSYDRQAAPAGHPGALLEWPTWPLNEETNE